MATSDYLRVSLPIDQKGRKKSPIPFSLPEEYGGFLQGFLLQEVVQIPGSLLGLLQGVEKAVKQISPIGRDQKDMGVGNPPPSRIHADEIRFKTLLKFPGYHPGHHEKALGLLLREVMPPGNMPFRNHQAVALSERVDVQDSYGRLILINPVSLCFSRNDLAENTIILGGFQNALLQNEKIQKPFPRILYKEAVERLQKLGSDIKYGDDFGGDDETVLTQKEEKPLMVHRYPANVKAFYMEPDPHDHDLALCVDVLAPEGYGEIIGGSQRIADHDLLLSRIKEHGLPQCAFQWYLDIRKYGTVKHGGFGIGLERTVAWICGLNHVRETIPYPRMLYKLYP